MKTDIKTLIIDVCGWIASILIIFFFFTFWLYSHNQNEQLLKDAWNITTSLLSGLATIGAAIIASRLFNDWRDQHNKQVNSEFIMKFYDSLFEMKATVISTMGYFKDYLNIRTLEERGDQQENLINHNRILCHLIDYSSQRLSDLAFILDEDDYDKNFKPKIEELHEKLMVLNDFFKLYINNTIAYSDACDILLRELPELEADLYNHYRSFMVELKRYYRA